ncbi:MAG TPA: T9SS type A sorting domain-containing protein, partial [Flavisolibacter sp.]
THNVAGAPTQNIAVSGNVFSNEPTITPVISFSNVTGNSMDIHFTGGNGSARIVVMRAASTVTGIPLDGTYYVANNNFGSGSHLQAGEYIVYNGTGNTVNVTGLAGNTIYHIAVFEYNDSGIAEAVNYIPLPATGSQATGSVPSGVQLTAANTIVSIDFDNTINYSNQAQFSGSGFSSNPIDGQLNSGAWAVSGWSDGDLLFNETRTAGDYARGFTLSHPATGGIYAFEPLAPGNRALGIQPGTGDWAPGTITLRLQNQTGLTLHSLGIAYKLIVYNNADRSSSFHFSYSTDNLNYIDINTLDYSSPSAADASPSWILNDRTTEIKSLTILPGQYLYIRWNSSDLSGTGSRDEFALDDITMIANPVSNPLPVRFTRLKATQRAGGIELEFSNATEENLVSYEVERSANGRSFTGIRQIPPTKNNGGNAVYSIMDETPLKGDNYYRIRSVEANGNNSFSSILRINTQAMQTGVALYPNPVHTPELCVQLSRLARGRYQILIFNAAGRQVLEKKVDHEGGSITQYLTVSQLPPGWYNVRIVGGIPCGAQFLKP